MRLSTHSPVPTNITRCFSPLAACTWLTMMRVNFAPFRTSRGLLPIGRTAWSMRGLSLMNWRVGSGRSSVWLMPASRASLLIHWWSGVEWSGGDRVDEWQTVSEQEQAGCQKLCLKRIALLQFSSWFYDSYTHMPKQCLDSQLQAEGRGRLHYT